MISIYVVFMIGVAPCIIHSNPTYYGRTYYPPYMYATPTNYAFQTAPMIYGNGAVHQNIEQPKSVPPQQLNQQEMTLQHYEQELKGLLNTMMRLRHPTNNDYAGNVETREPPATTPDPGVQHYTESVPQPYRQQVPIEHHNQGFNVLRDGNHKIPIRIHSPIIEDHMTVVSPQEPPTAHRGVQQQQQPTGAPTQHVQHYSTLEPKYYQDNNGTQHFFSITAPRHHYPTHDGGSHRYVVRPPIRKRPKKQHIIGEEQQRQLLEQLQEKKKQFRRKPPKKIWDNPTQRSKFIQSIYREFMLNREHSEDDFKKIHEKYGGTKKVEET